MLKTRFALYTLLIALQLCVLSDKASALQSKTSFCKSMLNDIKRIDSDGESLFAKYSELYMIARETGKLEDNLIQTRALLHLFENDRSIFFRALESRKCFTKIELSNLEEVLYNAETDALTVKSWIDAQIGIPGQNFYQKYVRFQKYITTPAAWALCGKKQEKYRNLVCKLYKGKLRWVDTQSSTKTNTEPTWPTGFINGQVNLDEAKKRISDYFEEDSKATSLSPEDMMKFVQKTSYPGLFDFKSEPKLTKCKERLELGQQAGKILAKYIVSVENIEPDPDWIITSGINGELIVNQKFKGQVFLVPVKLSVSQGDNTEIGPIRFRHVAIIDGVVYRFSAC